MSSALLLPRGQRPALTDVGERPTLLARQRVGRGSSRQRPSRGERRRRLGRRLGLTAAALLVFGLQGFGMYWILTTPRFAIARVDVRGASRVPPERILAVAGIVPGTNLWRLDTDAVVARLEALPAVRRAEVIRELPDRVTLLVEERRPFTLVHGGRLHWLDEEGRVLDEARDAVAPPVPVITGLSEDELANLRTEPSPKVRTAIALIRTLLRSQSRLVAEIAEIDMSQREGPVLYTVDGVEIRLGLEDWEERLARLEGVLAQLATGDDAVSAIDLRFRDQVVLKRGGQG